jgi:hypothetical protein
MEGNDPKGCNTTSILDVGGSDTPALELYTGHITGYSCRLLGN